MIQSWQDYSEIVMGLAIEGRISPSRLIPEEFTRPYDEIARAIKADSTVDKSELITKFGLSVIRTATDAAASLNGLGDSADWPELLRTSYNKYEISTGLESVVKKLQRGQDIDVPRTIELISRITTNKGSMVRMSDIEAGEMALLKTGVRAIDYHLGGVPEAGVTTVIAPPKIGKTSFLADLIASFVEVHKDKTAAVFTREMMEKHYKKRSLEVHGEISLEVQQRIVMNHDVASVGELASKASAVSELGIIGVDFADLLISGEVSPSKMEEIYRVLALLANQKQVPIILIAQLSRGYPGGIPQPKHIRWTGMAEALSWTIWGLYNPAKDFNAEKENLLPVIPGKAYIAAWFCRSKTKTELPGAIQLSWNGETGWSKNRGRWFSLEKASKGRKAEIEEDDENWSKEYEES